MRKVDPWYEFGRWVKRWRQAHPEDRREDIGLAIEEYGKCREEEKPCDLQDDKVDNPKHYQLGSYQAKDIAKKFMDRLDPAIGLWDAHCLCTALYYYLRAGKKGPAQEDYEKAEKWLSFMEDQF